MGRASSTKLGKRKRHGVSKWTSLDYDVLRNIFELVPNKDLFFRISRVCQWWRYVCRDILFWKDPCTLYLTQLKVFLGDYCPRKGLKEIELDTNVRRRLEYDYERRVKEALRGIHYSFKDKLKFVSELIFPPRLYITNDLLIYLWRRLPNLKKMALLGTEMISSSSLGGARLNWKKLEDLTIGPINHLEMITRSEIRPHLKTLCIVTKFTDFINYKLLSSLPQLQVLTIQNAILYLYGNNIRTILARCRQLSRLIVVDRLYRPDNATERCLSVDIQRNGA